MGIGACVCGRMQSARVITQHEQQFEKMELVSRVSKEARGGLHYPSLEALI